MVLKQEWHLEKVVKNNKIYKYSFPSGGSDQNVIIFGADISFLVHVDNKKKGILILGKGPTQELEHTLTPEKMHSITFMRRLEKKFCLS